MQEILLRAGGFIGLILLGYLLRRIGWCGDKTFRFLSRLITRVTLPAAIISGYSGKEIDPSMLLLAGLGLGCGLLYMLLGWLTNLHQSREQQAFSILNLSGYNIASFAIPFTQSFLGSVGVVATGLFDVGNACIVMGGACSVAAIVKDGQGFSLKRLLRTLCRSLPFLCYLIMTTLALLKIRLPQSVVTVTGSIGSLNAYAAMLMIGVGFRLKANREQLRGILRFFAVRYGVAVILALIFYFLLPFAQQIREALTILVFSPITLNAPPFTAEIDGDAGLSSAVNSISLVIGIVVIVALLLILL